MENPKIPGRIQMERSSRWKFSGKKVVPFDVLPFYKECQQVHRNKPAMSGAGSPSCRPESVQLNL